MIRKRGDVYHVDFFVGGQRYRQSLDTTDWREARAIEKDLIALAKAGRLASSSQGFARQGFSEAADSYLLERERRLESHERAVLENIRLNRERKKAKQQRIVVVAGDRRGALRSYLTEEERLKPLRKFFGQTPLRKINPTMLEDYVGQRKDAKVGNRTINMEIGCLRRVLKRAKLWHRFSEDYKPLPERRDIGRALDPEEKTKLLTKVANRPEWQVVRLAMTLALNTTMRACEIRGLRWQDINFLDRTLTVRRSKTDAGQRVIPLNADAMTAILELRDRAKIFFGDDLAPEWFVFPTCETHKRPDPTKPMSSWRTAWRKLTSESGLSGLRFHDLRHHAVTELAESQVSDQTIMSIAGHVSPRMLAHYSHVRLEAKRQALDALAGGAGKAGKVVPTIRLRHKTRHKSPSEPVAENDGLPINLLKRKKEEMVDVGGLEPPTPCLQSRCSAS